MFLRSPISCAHFLVRTVKEHFWTKKEGTERKKQLRSETIEFENEWLNSGFFDSSISPPPLKKN